MRIFTFLLTVSELAHWRAVGIEEVKISAGGHLIRRQLTLHDGVDVREPSGGRSLQQSSGAALVTESQRVFATSAVREMFTLPPSALDASLPQIRGQIVFAGPNIARLASDLRARFVLASGLAEVAKIDLRDISLRTRVVSDDILLQSEGGVVALIEVAASGCATSALNRSNNSVATSLGNADSSLPSSDLPKNDSQTQPTDKASGNATGTANVSNNGVDSNVLLGAASDGDVTRSGGTTGKLVLDFIISVGRAAAPNADSTTLNAVLDSLHPESAKTSLLSQLNKYEIPLENPAGIRVTGFTAYKNPPDVGEEGTRPQLSCAFDKDATMRGCSFNESTANCVEQTVPACGILDDKTSCCILASTARQMTRAPIRHDCEGR